MAKQEHKEKNTTPSQWGTVVKSTGSWYNVRLDATDDVWPCRIVGKFRLDDVPLTNPVAVGDRVAVMAETVDSRQQGVIHTIGERHNFVARQSPRRRHDLHLLAANIDQAVLIVTIVRPNLKPAFIDRFLIMTERFEIPVTIVFNKSDVWQAVERDAYATLRDVYTQIGYHTLETSTVDGTGVADFRALLANKTTLISGQSGVGKSSLVNAVQPQLQLRTGEISDYSGKGQHTTTFAEMFPLDFGGYLIDTPGLKMLSFNDKDMHNIAHSFREFFQLSASCRFGGNCLHRTEPGCAVQAAVAEGRVSGLRYDHYLTILAETEAQNYWEQDKQL